MSLRDFAAVRRVFEYCSSMPVSLSDFGWFVMSTKFCCHSLMKYLLNHGSTQTIKESLRSSALAVTSHRLTWMKENFVLLLLVAKLPGDYDDWLICMISSQVKQLIPDFDEIVNEAESDFTESGLKVPSIIRIGRLAVVSDDILLGAIGQISNEGLSRVKLRLADWLKM